MMGKDKNTRVELQNIIEIGYCTNGIQNIVDNLYPKRLLKAYIYTIMPKVAT